MKPHLPQPRGEITEGLCERLLRTPGPLPQVAMSSPDPVAEEDLQLALHICYGLSYDGFAGVSEEWEWMPPLLELRMNLEEAFLRRLLAEPQMQRTPPGARLEIAELQNQVRTRLTEESGPSLSTYMSELGTVETLRELLIHRSIYQRKEADPHTWAIPRVRDRASPLSCSSRLTNMGAVSPVSRTPSYLQRPWPFSIWIRVPGPTSTKYRA